MQESVSIQSKSVDLQKMCPQLKLEITVSIYPKPWPLGSHSQSFPKHRHFPPGHQLVPWRLRITVTLRNCAASSASAGGWETQDQCVTLQTCYEERTPFVGQAFSLSHPWVFLDEELLLLTLVPTRGFEGKSIWWHCRDVNTQSSKRGCRFINISWGLPNDLLTLPWNTTFTWSATASCSWDGVSFSHSQILTGLTGMCHSLPRGTFMSCFHWISFLLLCLANALL